MDGVNVGLMTFNDNVEGGMVTNAVVDIADVWATFNDTLEQTYAGLGVGNPTALLTAMTS